MMNFKVKVGAQSILENVIATVDGDSYNLNDHPGNFSRFNDCGEGYSCSTFEAPLSATLDGQVIKPSIQAIDVWGDSSSDNVSVMVDNSKPIIDSDAVVSESLQIQTWLGSSFLFGMKEAVLQASNTQPLTLAMFLIKRKMQITHIFISSCQKVSCKG